MQRSNPEIDKKYHSKRWQRLRKLKKTVSPFCEECEKQGRIRPTYIVHHKEWIDETNYKDDNVFYNLDNLESVCQDCHNKIHFEAKEEYYFTEDGDLKPKQAPQC